MPGRPLQDPEVAVHARGPSAGSWLTALGLAVVGLAPLAAHAAAAWCGEVWPAMLLASIQAAILAMLLIRLRHPAPPRAIGAAAAAMVGGLALAACLARPAAGPSLVIAITHAAIYGGLLIVFARSLRPGQDAVATRLARRIHAPLTNRRLAYTRRLTWVWAAYFACQLAASLPIAAWPAAPWAWMIKASDLPFAVALMAVELGVRSWVFRREPHATAADMMRAFRQGSLLQHTDGRPS